MTVFYLVFIFVHISFSVFVINDFNSAPLVWLARKSECKKSDDFVGVFCYFSVPFWKMLQN